MSSESTFPADVSIQWVGTIYDLTLDPIAGFKPTGIYFTLFDRDKADTGQASIVNSRLNVNVTANCTVAGVLTITLARGDMVLLDAGKNTERRGLLIWWDYGASLVDRGERTINFTIERNRVPTV